MLELALQGERDFLIGDERKLAGLYNDRPPERIPAFAKGWNDRVVVIASDGPGGAVDPVVWRNAVTHREA
jgi:hypothetical protein